MNKIAHAELVAQLIGRWPESHPQPSLERVRALCDLLGNPQDACPVIQITGTNGKGSTAIMIESLLANLGLRTGRFSSPHLVEVTERICIDGQPISAQDFDDLWQQIAALVEMVDAQLLGGVKMTFFEVVTAMAYAAFADAPVDVAVVEVGMGGTWDATSVANPKVSVVCPIDLDHTHLLGSTITQIATEKAGIIKPGCIAVLAGQNPQAAKVLSQRCIEVGVPMMREGVEFGLVDRRLAVGGQVIRIDSAGGPLGELYLPLFGSHMAHNAALAVAAVEALRGGHGLPADVIEQGLSAVQAPARLEVLHREPTVVLDTAHNPHGVRATLAGLREAMGEAQPVVGVLAMMRDKAVDQVLDLLEDELNQLVVTTIPDVARALSEQEVAGKAEAVFGPGRVQVAAQPLEALQLAMGLAQASDPEACVLVLGSVYLAGVVRPWLLEHMPQETPEVRFKVKPDVENPEWN